MINGYKCFNCECTDEDLIGVCIDCIESIMKRLNALPKEKNPSLVGTPSQQRCSCRYTNSDKYKKVTLLLQDCDEATIRMNEANHAKAKRCKASKP